MAAVAPVGIAAEVEHLDADRTRVPVLGVIGHALGCDEAVHRSGFGDVVVAAVSRALLGIVHALAELARHRHIGQFGAVDHDEIDRRQRAMVELGFVRQRPVMDDKVGGRRGYRHACSLACTEAACQHAIIRE